MKKDFSLRYSQPPKGHTKYNDPRYDEKRLWVSRLLSYFFLQGSVIISVDESNFRSDTLNPRQWTFDHSVTNKIFKRYRELAAKNVTATCDNH